MTEMMPLCQRRNFSFSFNVTILKHRNFIGFPENWRKKIGYFNVDKTYFLCHFVLGNDFFRMKLKQRNRIYHFSFLCRVCVRDREVLPKVTLARV